MLRFIKRLIKKIWKCVTPKPLWKMLKNIFHMDALNGRMDALNGRMDALNGRIESLARRQQYFSAIQRYESNGQVVYIYFRPESFVRLDGLVIGNTSYYGVDTFDIPRRIAVFLPDFPHDYISYEIGVEGKFFEQNDLQELNAFIPQNAVILDIGANIGNHSLYWGAIRKASKILAFEPVQRTFATLCKNIELNNLQGRVIPFNIGLGAKASLGKISASSYDNIGGTRIGFLEETETATGFSVSIDRLDNVISHLEQPPASIDFVKMDVEGFEIFALQGAEATLVKYTPTIFIETFPVNYDEVFNILSSYGYTLVKTFPNHNNLFIHKTKLPKHQ